MLCDAECFHFPITDLDLRGVATVVELCGDFQTAGIGCSANRIQHQIERAQRLSRPVDGDRTKQSMFHVVPLRGAARVMTDRDLQAGFVREPLQFTFPQSRTPAVAAAAIHLDQQSRGVGIPTALFLPPDADAADAELAGIAAGSHVDVPAVGGQVVNAIGNRPALRLAGKIVRVDFVRLITPPRSVVLERTDQLAVFRVGADHRLARFEKLALFSPDVTELAVAVRMRRTGKTLDVRPQRITEFLKQPTHRRVRDGLHFCRQCPQARANIPASSFGVAAGLFGQKPCQCLLDVGVFS